MSLSNLRFEPVVVTGVIVSVALLLGVTLDEAVVGEQVDQVFAALGVIAPIVTALIARTKTASLKFLDEESELGDPLPGVGANEPL